MAHRRVLLAALAVLATAAVAAASFADSNPIRPVTERAASTVESTILGALGRTRHALRFARFAVRHGKSYENAAEVQRRFRIFSESLQEVRSTNRKGLSYKLGINRFSDLSWEEFKATKLGAAQTCSATLAGNHLMRDANALPETERKWSSLLVVWDLAISLLRRWRPLLKARHSKMMDRNLQLLDCKRGEVLRIAWNH